MKTIDGFKLRQVCGENVIVSEGLGQVDFNKILSLSSSAAMLWQEVEGKDFDVDTLTRLLTEHYEVDQYTAHVDAEELLNDWLKANIVVQ